MDTTDRCATPATEPGRLIRPRELWEGRPEGFQIVGRGDADPTVLRAAAGTEAVQPRAGRRPPRG